MDMPRIELVLPDVDFSSAAFQSSPWETYANLRAASPICFSNSTRCFHFFCYNHVRDALTSDLFTSEFPGRASRQVLGRTLLDVGGHDHEFMRSEFVKYLDEKVTNSFAADYVEPVISKLLIRLRRREVFDLVKDFAVHLTYNVMCTILGLPTNRIPWLYRAMRPIAKSFDFPRGCLEKAAKSRNEVSEYICDLTRSGKPVCRNLIDRLDSAKSDQMLNRESVLAKYTIFLLLAGTETTISAISIILFYILSVADCRSLSLTDSINARQRMIRETLRLEPPVHSLLRFVTRKTQFDQIELPRHAPVLLSLASANRDESIFASPAEWLPFRSERAILTFGAGSHACPGSALAQIELDSTLRLLRDSFDRIVPAEKSAPQFFGHMFRRPRRLAVRWAR